MSDARRRARGPARVEALGEKLAEYFAGAAPPAPTGAAETGVLADTCAWIDYFRSGETPLSAALDGVLRGERLFTCGPVLLELLQGVRSDDERCAVMGALGALEYVEANPHTWVRAAGLAAEARAAGRRIPHSDLVIAALALEHDLAVLTVDRHFEGVPGLRVRIPPEGSAGGGRRT